MKALFVIKLSCKILVILTFLNLSAMFLTGQAIAQSAPILELRATIPFSKITGPNGQYVHSLGESTTGTNSSSHNPNFGYIRNGQSIYFGAGCWEFDLTTNTLKCGLPKNLGETYVAIDGTVLTGCLYQEWKRHVASAEVFYINTGAQKNVKPKYCYENVIHPSHKYVAAGADGIPYKSYKTFSITNMQTNKSVTISLKKSWASDFLGFSGDGKYLLAKQGSWIDIRNGKSHKHIGTTDVANYDGTLWANVESELDAESPKKEKGEIGEDVYNTVTKVYRLSSSGKKLKVGKGQHFGSPVAFSWNSAYLFISETGVSAWPTRNVLARLVDVATDQIIFDNLKGSVAAKFSPDGLSFVTTDNNNFYIYSLPTGSPPLFGKYPGPSYTPSF